MAYFLYNQNNSGGHYDINENVGINELVIIEAKNRKQANLKAEEIGIYFDGVEQEIDCECCGDRWNNCPEEIEKDELQEYKNNSNVCLHLI